MPFHALRIAHRGASGSAPENTLAAFQKAVDIGADLVETDVRVTADGEPALLHDATVDRTTDSDGPLKTLSLADVKRLDAGSWFAPEFAGERIPTLREGLELLRNRAIFLIEVKDSGIEGPLLQIIRETDSFRHVVLQSFDAEIVRNLRQTEPRLPCGLLLGQPPVDGPEEVRAAAIADATLSCGAGIAGLSGRMVTAGIVEYLRIRGIPVWVWTLNEPEEIRRATDCGVSGIISDFPERLGVGAGKSSATG